MESCGHIFSLSKISMETERYFVSFTTMHNEKLWLHFFSLSKISMETKIFCKLHNNAQWKVVVTFFHFLRSQWKQKDIFKIIDNGQL